MEGEKIKKNTIHEKAYKQGVNSSFSPRASYLKEASKIINGYAIVFNQRSQLLGNFYEVIDPYALEGLDLSNVLCLYDHDDSKILGRTRSNTLQLEVDDRGLKFQVEVPNTSYGNDLYSLCERGDISECSFGFLVNQEDPTAQVIEKLDENTYLRTIHKIDKLVEVSIVASPAYTQTTASIKRDYEDAIKDFEAQENENLSLQLELLKM